MEEKILQKKLVVYVLVSLVAIGILAGVFFGSKIKQLLITYKVNILPAEQPTPSATETWNCCGAGGAAAQVFRFNKNNGTLQGEAALPSGQVFAAITGSLDNKNITIITTYNDFAPGYVATFIGTIAESGATMSGNWSSNSNQTGTWTAERGT
jgi:hypothetical protein